MSAASDVAIRPPAAPAAWDASDLRHDAARRRAVPGRDDDLGREAARSPGSSRASASTSSRRAFPPPRPTTSTAVARDRQRGRARAPPRPIICGLARANEARHRPGVARRSRPATRPRIHTFLATSDIHLRAQAPHDARRRCSRASPRWSPTRARSAPTSSSRPEDAGRRDPAFLYEVLDVAIEAGATTLNIPDTVGYTTPDEFGARSRGIREQRAGRRARHHLGALPRRPRPRDRQHARRRSRRRAPGRGARSTASASARATPRSRRS